MGRLIGDQQNSPRPLLCGDICSAIAATGLKKASNQSGVTVAQAPIAAVAFWQIRPVRGELRLMGVLDDLEDLLDPIFDAVRGLFGGDDDKDDDDLTPQQRANEVLYGGDPGPLGPVPGAATGAPLPGGPSGLQQGADQAGTTYQQAGGAVAATDDKLAGLLKQIFASNDATRSQISDIINGLESAHRQLVSNPQLANDPHAVAWFNKLLDDRLGQIQQLLENSKVDSRKQAELLAALAEEYHDNSGNHAKDGKDDGTKDRNAKNDGSKDGANGGGSGDGDGGGSGRAGGGGGADPGASAASATPAGAGVIDPLAGLAGMPGGGMGDPLSMLGPALAGLGSLPGGLGGAASSLPMDALGSLAPLAGEMAGHGSGDGFDDSGSHDHTEPADFVDDGHGQPDRDCAKAGGGGTGNDDTGDKNSQTPAAGGPQPAAQQSAPANAAPASAGGDPGRVVQMPDGSAVTATSPQYATAVRGVLNGATVTDGWKQANVQLAPPGTPVTVPADPAHLVPGEVAQFKSREPVMYMGNGKIWLDGQLQPQSALPAGDFLGWEDPAKQAGGATQQAGGGRRRPGHNEHERCLNGLQRCGERGDRRRANRSSSHRR